MQPIAKKTTARGTPHLLIKPVDQGRLLILIVGVLVLMGGYWWYRGGHRGTLVEIDRALPLEAHFQVDINRAGWPEIIQLPGIGRILAERIVADRTEHGPFRSPEDLVRVNGVGGKTLQRIRPYLLPLPQEATRAATAVEQPTEAGQKTQSSAP